MESGNLKELYEKYHPNKESNIIYFTIDFVKNFKIQEEMIFL